MKNIDLGDNNHKLEAVFYKDELTGVNVLHNKPDGTPCVGGWCPFTDSTWHKQMDNSPIETWELIKQTPMTLSPSVLCRVCGDHGFIQEGKWVIA